ncbi:MAG: GAF domain-containing protein, partial [Magnetococcales bacterium]|nr:GAF domain-containing protein [Magnetococcales bacterium]
MSEPTLPPSKDKHPTHTLHSGLGRTLFLWFLGLTLLPLGVVSWRGYTEAIDAMHTSATQKLTTAVELKSQAIEAFFDEHEKDLHALSISRTNLHFLNELRTAWQASTTPVESFVQSFTWSVLVEKEGIDLKEFMATHKNHNIFLVEPGGAVLFSVNPDPLLGSNLLTDTKKHPRLSQAFHRAINQGISTFSDLELTESGDSHGYLIRRIVTESGETAGAVIIQLNMTPLLSLMENHAGFGETGETFLIGHDLLMRSNSRFTKNSIMRTKADTKITRQWLTEDTTKEKNSSWEGTIIRVMPETFSDYRGVEVLGIYADLGFLMPMNVHWALIAKLNASEFYAPATHLRNQILFIFLLTAILVILAAQGITRHIVTPLRNLTQWVHRIQNGELVQESIKAPDNELGTLVKAFGSMTDTLISTRDTTLHHLWMKKGAAQLNEQLRGERELSELANATLSFLAPFLGAYAGAFYSMRSRGGVVLCGSFALGLETRTQNFSFAPGEGMVGQCLLDKKPIHIHPVPTGYFRIQSGLGEAEPRHVLIYPFLLNDTITAIVELGSFEPFTEKHLDFLNAESKNIAMAVTATHTRILLQSTLERAQEQTKELQKNSEALKHSNREL